MKKKLWGLAVATSLFLAGCQSLPDESGTSTDANGDSLQAGTTRSQISNEHYRAMIVGGQYEPQRTQHYANSSAVGYNLNSFNEGLYHRSQEVFPTDQYYFAEGQIIEPDTLKSWLEPVSEDNPEGLNPANSHSNNPDSKEPLYLNQILENDFMIQKGDTFEVGGIAIGLAMNSIDYVEVDGKVEEREIPESEIEVQGKIIGNEIIKRLRQDEAYASVPILIGIFEMAPADSIAGGNYRFQGLSNSGNEVAEWVRSNRTSYVFKVDKIPNQDDLQLFENFRADITTIFPELSGVAAIGHYNKDNLEELDITISSKYGDYTELIALAQQTIDSASRYLMSEPKIIIEIEYINEPRIILTKEAGATTYHYTMGH